jgi:hypothetical protein
VEPGCDAFDREAPAEPPEVPLDIEDLSPPELEVLDSDSVLDVGVVLAAGAFEQPRMTRLPQKAPRAFACSFIFATPSSSASTHTTSATASAYHDTVCNA